MAGDHKALFTAHELNWHEPRVRNTCNPMVLSALQFANYRSQGRLSHLLFTATAAAIYSLGHGLRTFTAVPRSTQLPPSVGQ